MRRIFLAIPAPLEITNYQKKLWELNENFSVIKWTKEFNLHLTIYFIGNIKDEDLDRVIQSILPVIHSQEPFSLAFEKIVFAPAKKSKMIWARFYKNDVFTKFSHAVHDALSDILPENKIYYKEPVPHITLARFNSLKQIQGFTFAENPKVNSLTINSCQIWESLPSDTGVRYHEIASFEMNQKP